MKDAIDLTMDELSELAQKVCDGTITDRDADEQRAEMCTRHGPSAVRALDDFYEVQLNRVKNGDRTKSRG